MIVVKKCNKCGEKYDSEFMSNDKCICDKIKLQERKNRQQQPISRNRWNNVPIKNLPTSSNRRNAEAEAITSCFQQKNNR